MRTICCCAGVLAFGCIFSVLPFAVVGAFAYLVGSEAAQNIFLIVMIAGFIAMAFAIGKANGRS